MTILDSRFSMPHAPCSAIMSGDDYEYDQEEEGEKA